MMIDDITHRYQGFGNCHARCRIRIFKVPDDAIVVVATELRGNPGTSITNMAAQLATQIRQCYGIDPERLVWIEHYPGRGFLCPNSKSLTLVSFARVTFDWDGTAFSHPRRYGMSREEVDLLTGDQLHF